MVETPVDFDSPKEPENEALEVPSTKSKVEDELAKVWINDFSLFLPL